MRRIAPLLASAILAATAAGFLVSSPAGATPAEEGQFVTLMNQERSSRGLGTLAVSGDLVDYARAHSAEMASQNELRHSTRLRTLGNWVMLGENVGTGGSVQALHDAFMASSAHRENILRANFSQVGVGVVDSGRAIWVTVVFREPASVAASQVPTREDVVELVSTPSGGGYWLVTRSGAVYGYGDGRYLGGANTLALGAPIVGAAGTPSGNGYWLLGSDGGIFSFGDAGFYGSTGALRLAQPIVGMAPTPSGRGYWLVAADGGIFSFGDAGFYGSTGALRLNQPIVGMAPTPSGRGYWLVAADGGIFSFGDAGFYGSTGALRLAQPITGMTASRDGRGYWLVAADGGIFSFGDAGFYGSEGGSGATFSGMSATPGGDGYWLVSRTGQVFGFGGVAFLGSL